MSLEGGFDELPEFFSALANCDSSSATRCSNAAKRSSRSLQCGHPDSLEFAIVANNVDQSPNSTNINPTTVDGYQNQKDLIDAMPLFPNGPYVTMEFDRNGELTQVSGHALDKHFTAVSRAIAASGVQSNLVLDAGRLRGEIRLPSGSDETLSFYGRINVIHFAK